MRRDFSSCMLAAVIGLPIFLLIFIVGLYVANCGLSTDCSQASLPAIIHTPIPSLIPASLPLPRGGNQATTKAECLISARDLLSTWVSSGYPEDQLLSFSDVNGNICNATFTDVMPLFSQPNVWYPGALACDACHNSTLSAASAYLDLSSYQGILAGWNRSSPTSRGQDILGGGNWDNSVLNKVLFVDKIMPFGAPSGTLTADGPMIHAGSLATIPTSAPTESTTQEEVARPGNPGGPGEALTLKGDATAGQKVFVDHCQVCHGIEGLDNVPNPGSDDGTVPPLNPIDPTLVSPDYATFAYNVDLFLQNGSVPEGPNAVFRMPAWGELGILTQQQIADVIAYIISLNQ